MRVLNWPVVEWFLEFLAGMGNFKGICFDNSA